MLSKTARVFTILASGWYLGERLYKAALVLKYNQRIKPVKAARRKLAEATKQSHMTAELEWEENGKPIAQAHLNDAGVPRFLFQAGSSDLMLESIKAQYVQFLVCCITRKESAALVEVLKKTAPDADLRDQFDELIDGQDEHYANHRALLTEFGFNVDEIEKKFVAA
ncbi:MAG: hypothetical protein ABIQ04_04710 [Candidatus Saccharimonadales bacterium]